VDRFEAVFDKGEYAPAYSGFEGKSQDGETLVGWLAERGVERVEVCGIATDYCVRATALDAKRAGFDTSVLVGLTAAVAPDRVAETLHALEQVGVRVQRGA
jgi:nicotinamidase/pyrazinamidase